MTALKAGCAVPGFFDVRLFLTNLLWLDNIVFGNDLELSRDINDNFLKKVDLKKQLTEERRKELAKQVRAAAEKGKVAVRNVRREMMDSLKKAQKNGDMSEDVLHDLEDEAQKITDASIKNIDGITAAKEKEILAE